MRAEEEEEERRRRERERERERDCFIPGILFQRTRGTSRRLEVLEGRRSGFEWHHCLLLLLRRRRHHHHLLLLYSSLSLALHPLRERPSWRLAWRFSFDPRKTKSENEKKKKEQKKEKRDRKTGEVSLSLSRTEEEEEEAFLSSCLSTKYSPLESMLS